MAQVSVGLSFIPRPPGLVRVAAVRLAVRAPYKNIQDDFKRSARTVPETILVTPSKAIKVEKVSDESRIADFLSVEQAIWSRTRLSHEQLGSSLSDPLERDVGFLAYQDEKPVGFARLTTSPDSAFAGLWGGGVLENFRGTGVYRALLAARIAEAKTRPGVRFLRVDALPTSQPILEKYSFVCVAKTWPCNWPDN
jgi:GNAT superfamily N-acetyltransferase